MTVVASNYARKENDLYQTEPWATEALLRHFPVGASDHVWEPAAGNHLMADVIRETGARVRTTDNAMHANLLQWAANGRRRAAEAAKLIHRDLFGAEMARAG